ncbi:MAG: hypothetical protein RG740_01930, partial [Acholeplasmataceae bacterium]|nr:hypothetical protein [Acholeplasmataceae bacterium]
MYNRVANALLSSNRDSYISKMNLSFIIPNDQTNTKIVADYTGQYLIVNAIKFLKVYLSYFGYHIKPSYDVATDTITFEFKKRSAVIVPIRLKDFTHEKTSNDIKVNRTIATIAYKPVAIDPDWEESNETYYNGQPENNKASIVYSETLPSTAGYSQGFALKVTGGHQWISATLSDYNNATNKLNKSIIQDSVTCSFVSESVAISEAGDPNQYYDGTVIAFRYAISQGGTIALCTETTYLRLEYQEGMVSYYKRGEVTFTKRPDLPERVYLLGKDNQIYEGYNSIAEENRIYPIVSKMFEAQYLSEAQINAVYELVNNRYSENIIITINNMANPMDLSELELNTMVRVYDADSYKDIPISEKTTLYSKKEARTEIKLGFKKTLLTEIIKNDIGLPDVVKSSGGGSGAGNTTIVEEYQIWTGNDAPNPDSYETWFKPVSGTEEGLMEPMGFQTESTTEPEPDEHEVTEEEVYEDTYEL